MAFADDMLWVALVGLIKISILDLYTTIFPNRSFIRIAHSLIGLCCAVMIAFLIERALICRPVAYNWDTNINGSCGNTSEQYIAIVSIDLIIDVFIIVLPMPVLWGLQLKTSKKLAIMAIFALGFV